MRILSPQTPVPEAPPGVSVTADPAVRTPRWSDARDQMIHASALQEHIIAMGPVLPKQITITERAGLARGYTFPTGETDIVVYLSHNAEGVRAYQDFLGGVLREELMPPVDSRRQQVKVTLRGQAFGCSFRVETLADAPVQVNQ